MRLYVGNLPFSTTDADLRQLFEEHGSVREASVVTDRDSGRSRGFGFVLMDDPAQARAAIETLNGYMLGGRSLTVNEARPREDRGGFEGRRFAGPGRGGPRGGRGGWHGHEGRPPRGPGGGADRWSRGRERGDAGRRGGWGQSPGRGGRGGWSSGGDDEG
ncbi:MAG: RNA-binding protein [Myxococcota bacterium]|nr:RNA-binding protein [Myxococcota bacterium]MDW8361697.1 RNA-binding protein [Myxococcales bacterium]